MDFFSRYKNILLILLLVFFVRFVNIGAPLLGPQDWRQCDTAAIARNFYENGMSFFYPQVDWAGEKPGYVEMEFPLYPYMAAAFYKLFGVHEFFGRLISIIASVFAALFLYLLTKETIDETAARYASVFFAILPLTAFYTSSFQPEALFIMCSLAGIYYLLRWTASDMPAHFFVSAAFISLSCLLKITNLYMCIPVFYIFWLKFRGAAPLKPSFWLYGAIVLLPAGLWYHHAHNIFLEYGTTFGIWDHGTGKWLNLDFLKPYFFKNVFFFSLFIKHFAVFGFPVFIAGLFMKRMNERERLFDLWLFGVVIYLVVVARGNALHEYYQLPVALLGAVYMGKFFARHNGGKKITGVYFFLIIAMSAMIYAVYIPLQSSSGSDIFNFASVISEKLPDKKLVIHVETNEPRWVFPGCRPVLLYHAHKKGWVVSASEINDKYLAEKKALGAGYILGAREYFDTPDRMAFLKLLLDGGREIIYNDEKNFIVRL